MSGMVRSSVVGKFVPETRLMGLLLTSALASMPVAALSQTVVWDAGDPTSNAINNADGEWNDDAGNPTPWNGGGAGGGGGEDFSTGDNVVFSEGAGPANVTVTITEDVIPSSITFEDDATDDTTFTINSSDPAHEILSTEGDIGGIDSGLMRIRMNDAAIINAGLNGRFEVVGSETLTLGGVSENLVRLTVENDLELVVTSTADISGTIDMDDGDLVIAGTVENVETSTGTTVEVNPTGQITGILTNRGDATIDGQVAALTNNTGGTVDLNATGTVTGLFNNFAEANIAGNVERLENRSSGEVTFDGSMTIGAGGFENFGTADIRTGVTVTVTGDTTISGGTVTIDAGGFLAGDVDVVLTGRLVIDGQVTGDVSSDNLVTLNGAVVGEFDNLSNGELDMAAAGSISGTLTNEGTAEISGTLGGLVNEDTGEATFDGATTVSGLIDNDGEMTVANGITLTANGGVENGGTGRIEVEANGIIAGQLTNQTGGFVLLRNGSALTGGMTNAGTLEIDGAATVEGLNSTGTIDLADGAGNDVLNLTGPGTLNGRIELDIDLSGTSTVSDRIAAAGDITGNVLLSFSQIGTGFGPLTTPITVMSFGPGSSINATAEGLIGVGALVYALDSSNPGELRVISFANPGVGAVVGSITLTQSLIGSVINRPSSPFVTGLAGESDKACRPGVWARALGGRADANGTTESLDTSGASRIYDSLVSSTYSGIQLGGDISCFDGPIAGWDMSFGGILGVNNGSTTQPVFGVDGTGSALPDIIVSNNSTDFQQTYAGVYLSAVKDRLLFDLQYRLERTSFDLSNDGTGAERIGIVDQTFKSTGQTLSGSLSYVIPVNKDLGINFVPTAGFAITKFKTDSLVFSDGGRLDIDDGSTEVGFIGAALSMSRILPSGNAALTYFATGTYYKDFADPLRSVYSAGSSGGGTAETYSSNLGQYSEASIGLNYTQLLSPGNAILNAKQLNASVRLDSRFGETLDSWGVTAQMRLQF